MIFLVADDVKSPWHLSFAAGQMFLLDRFFDGTFLTFGIEVISFADRDQEDRIDPMVYIFPRFVTNIYFVYIFYGHFFFNTNPFWQRMYGHQIRVSAKSDLKALKFTTIETKGSYQQSKQISSFDKLFNQLGIHILTLHCSSPSVEYKNTTQHYKC